MFEEGWQQWRGEDGLGSISWAADYLSYVRRGMNLGTFLAHHNKCLN